MKEMHIHARLMNGLGHVNERGCWIWGRSTMSSGYGHISSGRREGIRMLGAHRVSYEMFNGPIPPGLVVMHSCDEKLCINPAHLSVGTKSENSRDMTRKGRNFSAPRLRTHCPKGHEYSGTNSRGARICRICNSAATLRHYHRTKKLKGAS